MDPRLAIAQHRSILRRCILTLLAGAWATLPAGAQLENVTPPFVPPSTNDVNTPVANAVVLVNLENPGCTGTLIREDLVISAGHCAPPSFDGQGVPNNVWQRVDRWYPNSDWNVQFGNDRQNLIHTARVTHFASSRNNDLVLLALERPVSPAIAIPVPPLLANPKVDWSREVFTLAGWGAINDAATSYPRFRQVVSAYNGQFPCASHVNKFCVLNGGPQARPGDSGGPVLWRDRSGRRFLLGELQNTGGEYYATFGPGNSTYGSIANLLSQMTTGPNPNAFLKANCTTGERPGATLLFPYFEVDLDRATGQTTLISIQNRGPSAVQIHVALWTDWGKPTLTFDQTLAPLALQTLNLRDVFASGRGPVDAPFSGCPNPAKNPSALQAMHTGRLPALSPGCFSEPRAGRRATGYLTVDTVLAGYCGRDGDFDPWEERYFAEDLSRRATDQNVLAGDFFLLDVGSNYAQGFDAVSLVADPTKFPGGTTSFSFWGKYVDYEGRDHRAPLSDLWSVRYGVGGGFDAGTDLFVWRDVADDNLGPVGCATHPSWVPLGERLVVQRSEAGAIGPPYSNPSFFPLATQRVAAAALSPGTPFGTLQLDLGHPDGGSAQAWVGWTMSASGRFSVGQAGIPTHDLCDPVGTTIGRPGAATARSTE